MSVTRPDRACCCNDLGACCLPDGTCLDTTESDCLERSGVFQGVGTKCAETDCPEPPPVIEPCTTGHIALVTFAGWIARQPTDCCDDSFASGSSINGTYAVPSTGGSSYVLDTGRSLTQTNFVVGSNCQELINSGTGKLWIFLTLDCTTTPIRVVRVRGEFLGDSGFGFNGGVASEACNFFIAQAVPNTIQRALSCSLKRPCQGNLVGGMWYGNSGSIRVDV